MPPGKAGKRKQRESVGSGEEASSDIESREEQDEESRATPQDDNDDESDVGEADRGKTEGKGRQKGLTLAEKRKWRRLAIEEKEALVNEGGMVWKAAKPLMANLPSKHQKEMTTLLRSALRNAEMKLDGVLVPPTIRMPHASRNVGIGAGLSSATSGSIAGSVMSWQVERGAGLYEEGEAEDRDEMALLELGGFSSDIAVLESLLLPEATETVSMTRAIEEQEKELELSKEQLVRLKADRESKKKEGEQAGSEVSSRIEEYFELSDRQLKLSPSTASFNRDSTEPKHYWRLSCIQRKLLPLEKQQLRHLSNSAT